MGNLGTQALYFSSKIFQIVKTQPRVLILILYKIITHVKIIFLQQILPRRYVHNKRAKK
jgi:hypothetical protein